MEDTVIQNNVSLVPSPIFENNQNLDKQDGFSKKEIFPVYVRKLGKPMFLSKTRKLLVDTFLATRNYSECQRVLKAQLDTDLTYEAIKRHLNYPEVQEYIMERFEDLSYYNSWTKEKWFTVMTKHINGVERLQNGDLYAMNLIGKFSGWGNEAGGNSKIQNINFVQIDGRA